MSSFSSLSRAISGLMANQTALNTVAHNLSNVNTKGYVRQQIVMEDSNYQTVGVGSNSLKQVGSGTDVAAIRQVRDRFLDSAFREENSRYGFYSAQSAAIDEIESILGETEGEAFSDVLNDFWAALNELSKNPESLETRASLVEHAVLFAESANQIAKGLAEYQTNLNTKVKKMVDRINEIGDRIDQLNDKIASAEITGKIANDYRDERNVLLDELSGYVDLRTTEDTSGRVSVYLENTPFVTLSGYHEMETYQAGKNEMLTPYWPHLSDEANSQYRNVCNLDEVIDSEHENDKGELKGLLMSRGSRPADYTDLSNPAYEDEVKDSIIMTIQAQFDTLVHGVVTMINDTLAPSVSGPPYGLDGSAGYELFSRNFYDRFDGSGTLIGEDPTNPDTLYSAGNIHVNEDILANYNYVCISKEVGYNGDSSVVESMLEKWDEPFAAVSPDENGKVDYNDFYNNMISNFGSRGSTIGNQVDNQETVIAQIDNQRSSLMGVSSDDELGNMIVFQHAYNASAKVVNVIDEMIQTVISSTGLVGR